MSDFTAAGLGLQYGTVRLVKTDDAWGEIGRDLAAETARTLADAATAVEHVGSTSVPGLLAKPIIDLAIAVPQGVTVDLVEERLSTAGWKYRGDAGDDGGWVFVLEDAPWHRVAHAHGVETGGAQWVRYIQFRELLRESAAARATYEAAKADLAREHPDGRKLYTAGKDAIVKRLLGG